MTKSALNYDQWNLVLMDVISYLLRKQNVYIGSLNFFFTTYFAYENRSNKTKVLSFLKGGPFLEIIKS